jgi:hypothetical protein
MVLPTAVSRGSLEVLRPRGVPCRMVRQPPRAVPLARGDRRIRGSIDAVLSRGRSEPITTTALDAVCCSVCARSSTDRASDYGSEGWGFESLRARRSEGGYRLVTPLLCAYTATGRPACLPGSSSTSARSCAGS